MTPAPNALLTSFTPASGSALIYDFSNGFLSTGPEKLLLPQNIPPSKSCPSSIPSPSRARGLLRAGERTFKGLPLSSAGSDPKRTHIHTHKCVIKGLVEAHKEESKAFRRLRGCFAILLLLHMDRRVLPLRRDLRQPHKADRKSFQSTEPGLFFLPPLKSQKNIEKCLCRRINHTQRNLLGPVKQPVLSALAVCSSFFWEAAQTCFPFGISQGSCSSR